MDYKIAIIGKKEEILAFKGLGLDVIFANTAKEGESILLEMKSSEENSYAIIFISEDFFQEFDPEIVSKVSEGALPALVPIPGIKGSTGFGDKRMKKFVEQAVGSDIFGE